MAKAAKVVQPRRGEVYLVSLDPTVGAEIRKTRPAVVVQMAAAPGPAEAGSQKLESGNVPFGVLASKPPSRSFSAAACRSGAPPSKHAGSTTTTKARKMRIRSVRFTSVLTIKAKTAAK